MKTKHTPGPWRFNKNKTALLALNKNNEHVFIYNASPYNSMEPSSKDAALIAAAPEMLSALEDCLNEFDKYQQYFPKNAKIEQFMDKLGVILNKAKGG